MAIRLAGTTSQPDNTSVMNASTISIECECSWSLAWKVAEVLISLGLIAS